METTVQKDGKRVMAVLVAPCLTGLVVLIVLIVKGVRRLKHIAEN